MEKSNIKVECYVGKNHWYTLTYERGYLRMIEASKESARLVCYNVPTTTSELKNAIKVAQKSKDDIEFRIL